jgi:hypothetical protein
MSKVGRSRTHFEGKLCKLLMNVHKDWFALTSGNNQGWDVHLFRPTNNPWNDVVLFEVKTSIKQSITFSGTSYDQLKRYRSIWKNERIPTFYAFRWVTSIKRYNDRPFNETDKWRFFHIDNVGKTLKWERGMEWKSFMGRFK